MAWECKVRTTPVFLGYEPRVYCTRVLLSTDSSASTTTTTDRRPVRADLAIGPHVVQRIVRTLGRALDVEAEVVRISRRRLSDPVEVHIEHRVIGGLGFARGGSCGHTVTIVLLLVVVVVVVIVPESGRLCCACASGGRCRTTRRELTVSVRALGRAECVFAEHVRGLGRFRAVVVGYSSRLLLLIIVIVVVIVITVTVITRASRMQITMICTRGLVVEILVVIPRRCRWRRWWCGGGGCRCGGGCGGGCGRRATGWFIKFFLLT